MAGKVVSIALEDDPLQLKIFLANRKVAEANTSLATKALGNKLARICYYVMRDRVPFREEIIAH